MTGIANITTAQPTIIPVVNPLVAGSMAAAKPSEKVLNPVAPITAPSRGLAFFPSFLDSYPSISIPRYIPMRTIPLSMAPNANPSNI